MSKAKEIIKALNEEEKSWDVILGGKVQRTIQYDAKTTDEVRKKLIADGDDPRITVRKHKEG